MTLSLLIAACDVYMSHCGDREWGDMQRGPPSGLEPRTLAVTYPCDTSAIYILYLWGFLLGVAAFLPSLDKPAFPITACQKLFPFNFGFLFFQSPAFPLVHGWEHTCY